MKRLFFVLLFTCCSASAFAQMTGNELLRDCQLSVKPEPQMTQEDFAHSIHCLGYVSGVIDTLSLWRGASEEKHLRPPDLPCFPEGHLENLQVVRVVLKFLEDNPEKLHMDAPVLILIALRKAFPCK